VVASAAGYAGIAGEVAVVERAAAAAGMDEEVLAAFAVASLTVVAA